LGPPLSLLPLLLLLPPCKLLCPYRPTPAPQEHLPSWKPLSRQARAEGWICDAMVRLCRGRVVFVGSAHGGTIPYGIYHLHQLGEIDAIFEKAALNRQAERLRGERSHESNV